MRPNGYSSGAFVGLVLVAFGVLLLLDQTGVIAIGNPARWIPSAFVVLGVWALVSSRFRNLWGPLGLILVAGVVQVAVLGGDFWGSFWPAVLIAMGLLVLLRGQLGRWRQNSRSQGDLNVFTAFGSEDQAIRTSDFRGGQITALFGGAKIDLRGSSVANPPAEVELMVMFGGTELWVPPEWDVRIQTVALFGGSKDARRDNPTKPSTDVWIRGLVLFGGLEIKG